jgi:nucleotide-binding universal stress UspA family protein
MVPPMVFDSGLYTAETDWASAMREAIETRMDQARQIFETAAKARGEKARWLSGIQLPGPAIAAASRAADLIVAGGASGRHHDAYRDALPAELALTAGRPVLVIPTHGAPLKAARIVLAWKDAREARRALSDAMPFLLAAEAVFVVSVCAEIDAEQARIQVEDVVAALSRRGGRAVGEVVVSSHPDAREVLGHAQAKDADLVVAGAYGHSRFGEWAFGGFTRDLLAQDERYLLLSH